MLGPDFVAKAAPEVRDKLAAAGIEPAGGTPQQFKDLIQSEMACGSQVAKTAGIEAE